MSAMKTRVFVISDLHLGGAEEFRMCSPTAVGRIAALVGWIAGQRERGQDVHLVLNGDIVDFLAERDSGSPPEGRWSAFTIDQEEAAAKLDRILDSTAPAWDALASFVASGSALTMLLGNHDIELALPKLRHRLFSRIAPSGGRIELIHDNEAFTLGGLVVEHGNRYDGWNAVDHDALRRVRSALSRAQPPQPFPVQPGSEMVVRVMNRIKSRYAFVDLLKPETSAVAPLLAVLSPSVWKMAGGFVRQAAAAARRGIQTGAAGPAADNGLVAARAVAEPRPVAPAPDDEGLRLADEFASAAAARAGAKVGFVRDVAIDLLLNAFRNRRKQDGVSFDVEVEAGVYLEAAASLASRGFQVVVFGHTHHAKRISLGKGTTYLNSGTWADLMRIPDTVYEGDPAAGEAALRAWLDELAANRIERYRRFLPTFVQVDLEADGRVAAADVHFFDGPNMVQRVETAKVIDRLGLGDAT